MTFIEELRGVARQMNSATISLNKALGTLQAIKDDVEVHTKELYIPTELVSVNRLIKTDYDELKKGLDEFQSLMHDMYSALVQQRMATVLEMLDRTALRSEDN